MHRLPRLLQVAAFGDIPVDLHNSAAVSLHIADQRLAAFNDHDPAISAGMYEFPFPALMLCEMRLDVSTAAFVTRSPVLATALPL
jgi:hypothetical protein